MDRGQPLAKGFVGGWLFNEGGGSVVHDICGKNPGTITGGLGSDITWTDEPTHSGEPSVANGLHFSGQNTNNRVDLGSIVSDNPLSLSGKTKATFAFGISLPSDALHITNQFPRIIDKSDGGGGSAGWALWIGSPGTRLTLARPGASAESGAVPADIVVEGGYVDVVVFRDGDSVGFARDGALQQTVSGFGATAFPSNTANAAIGNWNHSVNREFKGTLYYLYVWNRLLPGSVIQALARDPYYFLTTSTDFARFEAIREILGMVSAGVADSAWETQTATLGKSVLIDAAAAEGAWEGPAAALNVHRLIEAGTAEAAWEGVVARLNKPVAAVSVDTVWEQCCAQITKHVFVDAAVVTTAWDADAAAVAKNTGVSASVVTTTWEPRRQGLYQLISVAWETGQATLSKHVAISAGAPAESAWEAYGVGFATAESVWETASAAFNKHKAIAAAVADTALETPDAGVSYLLHWLTSNATLNKHTGIAVGSVSAAFEVYDAANINQHTGIAATAGEVAFTPQPATKSTATLIAANATESAYATQDATLVFNTQLAASAAATTWVSVSASFNKHTSFTASTQSLGVEAAGVTIGKSKLIAVGGADTAYTPQQASINTSVVATLVDCAWETLDASFVRDEVNTEWTLPRTT